MARRLLTSLVLGLVLLTTVAGARQVPEEIPSLPPVVPGGLPDDEPPNPNLPPAKEPPGALPPLGGPELDIPSAGSPDDSGAVPRPSAVDPQVERVAVQQAGAAPATGGAPPSFVDRLAEGPQEVGLVVDVAGPPTANLNIDTNLTITVRNQGKNDAHEVVVTDVLPENLTFVEANPRPDRQEGNVLVWRLGTMGPDAEKSIDLKVTPIKDGPLDHVPRVDFSTGAKGKLTILKPTLKVEITASESEALKGKEVVFNVTVINTGNGMARGVVLEAEISNGLEHDGEAKIFSQTLGDLDAQQSTKQIPFAVYGKALGPQTCTVRVISSDVVPKGDASEAVGKLNIIAPDLKVEVLGPDTWPKGTVAQYMIKVTNNGTAPAEKVMVAAFPPVTGRPIEPPDATLQPDERNRFTKIYWQVERIDPGQSRDFPLQIKLEKIQDYKLDVAVNAQGARPEQRIETVRADKTTSVEGLPEVRIVSVRRSSQVIGLGDPAEFTIVLENVGSEVAEDVQVGVELSSQIKVESTDGTAEAAVANPMDPNLIAFPAIDRIEVGKEHILTVRVQGASEGIAKFQVSTFWKGLDQALAVFTKTNIRVAKGAGTGGGVIR